MAVSAAACCCMSVSLGTLLHAIQVSEQRIIHLFMFVCVCVFCSVLQTEDGASDTAMPASPPLPPATASTAAVDAPVLPPPVPMGHAYSDDEDDYGVHGVDGVGDGAGYSRVTTATTSNTGRSGELSDTVMCTDTADRGLVWATQQQEHQAQVLVEAVTATHDCTKMLDDERCVCIALRGLWHTAAALTPNTCQAPQKRAQARREELLKKECPFTPTMPTRNVGLQHTMSATM